MVKRAHKFGLVCAGLFALITGGQAADGVCIGDWSDAAPIAQKEGLVTVEDIVQLHHEQLKGDIVKTMLCKESGRYLYRFVVRKAGGELKTIAVDARQPFER
jgi:uncharacterized membrane protein YkoI